MTIIYFIIALGILIFVHEFGHFIMAKRAGVRVDEFSLGFGPRLFGIKRGDTDYRISAFPLGGYVKMFGEDPSEVSRDPASYANKTLWQRTRIVAFGPLMNIIFALVVMPLVFMAGRMEPVFLSQEPMVIGINENSPASQAGFKEGDILKSIDGKNMSTWEDTLQSIMISPGRELNVVIERSGGRLEKKLLVAKNEAEEYGYSGLEPMLFLGKGALLQLVNAGSPAAKAGLEVGDLIVEINGERIKNFLQLAPKINESKGKKVDLKVERDGGTFSASVLPEFSGDLDRWVVGVVMDPYGGMEMVSKRFGIIDSIIYGTKENIKVAGLAFKIIRKLITLELSYKALGGPVIIAKASASAAASGFSNFIYFLAFLSVQLAILNLLPIPVLDGGHLLFFGIEAINRRPVSRKVRLVATQVGFYFLVTFMILVTWNDINKVVDIKGLIDKIF